MPTHDILWTGSHGSYREAHSLELACPLLLIYGRRKPFLFHSPQWAMTLADQPDCAVVAVEAGHWVMQGDPAGVNAAILRWT